MARKTIEEKIAEAKKKNNNIQIVLKIKETKTRN